MTSGDHWHYMFRSVPMIGKRRMSKKPNLDAMSIDEMWQLHEDVIRALSTRLTSEKRELEKRLAQLRLEKGEMLRSDPVNRNLKKGASGQRRQYPKVFPKYRNPNDPSETWSGRGKKPRWLTAALKAGHPIEDFVISNSERDKNRLQWAGPAAE
jgi:DNA-binding protein H-NS